MFPLTSTSRHLKLLLKCVTINENVGVGVAKFGTLTRTSSVDEQTKDDHKSCPINSNLKFCCTTTTKTYKDVDIDIDVEVERTQAQAIASLPDSITHLLCLL